MNESAANFDRLARVYRLLEFIAFGRDLERARFCFLDRLADCRSILVLGEGDGRCVARLAQLAPAAKIHCVDASPAMIARAALRAAAAGAENRVTFSCADATRMNFPAANYDAVVTFFFLDCFDAATAARVIDKIGAALRPNALWLHADFALPERGLARWRAQAWLAVLYAFFRWQTGLRTRALPPAETLICAQGFAPESTRSFQAGLLRSALFRR
jgi:ubiquinone/menaquinone biosynthesis C-methylase UbiE